MSKKRQSQIHLFLFIFLFIAFWLLTVLIQQPIALAAEGKLVFNRLYSPALEGNLLGDPPERRVIVYLPPSYETFPTKRYPVVYLLHGYTFTNEVWLSDNTYTDNVAKMMDKLISKGKVQEMILVMPDANNRYGGSFYTNSPTTGNWEDFITKELVAYIDRRYRTLPQAASRGITGHSMGGYGALKLAMKYPEIYSTVYGMGSCCLRFNWVAEIQDPAWITALNLKESKQFSMAGFGPQSKIALSAAFSPNPSRPPFFVDFPFELVNGNGNRKLKPVEDVQDKWTTNSPLTMLKQYQSNLLKLGRIRFDVGNRDPNLAQSRDFSQALAAARIRHVFEEYNGNHINRIEERMENKVLPFLSNALNPQAKLSTMWGEIKKSIP